MRALWLASATFIVTAGIACAQTMSPTPAPNGATNAPMEAPTAPGKTAPAGVMPESGMSSPTMSPQATGNMAPSNATQSMNTPASGTMHSMHHHHYMSVSDNGSVTMYLHVAKTAIMHHDRARGEDALSHAETRLLTRAVPQSANMSPDNSPGVTAVINARAALKSGDFTQASQDVSQAMQEAGPDTGGDMSSPMSANPGIPPATGNGMGPTGPAANVGNVTGTTAPSK